jgi:DNA repair protein RadC
MEMTNQIVTAAKAVDLKVHDHLIIGRELETSFKHLQLI